MSILSTNRNLAVVGDPIEHSRSPQLHLAAYSVLGLNWDYMRQRVALGELASFVDRCGAGWRGLSVTMPLKVEAYELAAQRDESSQLTGVANTLLFAEHGGQDTSRSMHAFNTDVAGLTNPLRRLGVGLDADFAAVIIGSGATALSAVVALRDLGCSDVTTVARNKSSASSVVSLAEQLGLTSTFIPLDDLADVDPTPVTISTIPGRAHVSLEARAVSAGNVLFDIAYDVWPSVNAVAWTNRGGRTLSGLSMLAAQALEQVRIFVTGLSDGVLEREDEIRSAMNAAVGLDETGLIVRSVG